MAGANIPEEGAIRIANSLAEGNCTLEDLSLSNNRIGNKAAAAFGTTVAAILSSASSF